ncbi:hypothetical protein ACS0TY_008706 [Phlomoides rotata]
MDDYMMEESVGSSEQLDRLSELPQSLILHILSFLRMRDVVKTTLLSKRWENLWTTLPCLNFSDIISEDDELDSNRVRNFVNRALLFWKGTKLLKFIIEIRDHFDTSSLAGDMDLWVRFAVINKVEELNILLEYDEGVLDCEEDAGSSKDIYRAPECLNSCSSIRKLSLVGCNLRVRKSPTWNQLKSLQINGFSFSERLINRILLGTPRLEVFELSLVESNKNLNIRSTSLKKLKINKYLYFVDEQPSLDSILRICCPNLETLEISGVYYGIELLGETMRYMFSTFQHVERVALSSSSFQMIGAAQKKNLFSPLPNVVLLKVGVHLIKLVEMVRLLEIFPNLKMLILEDQSRLRSRGINAENYSEFKTNLTKSFMLQLKIIEIISDFYNSSMFRYVEFLLKHCSMLEKLVVRAKRSTEFLLKHSTMLESMLEELVVRAKRGTSLSPVRSLEIAERLLRMPRSSPNAEVIFNKN